MKKTWCICGHHADDHIVNGIGPCDLCNCDEYYEEDDVYEEDDPITLLTQGALYES